eukprot:6486136-Amphidinium_carterae.1
MQPVDWAAVLEGRCVGGVLQGVVPGGLLCASVYLKRAVDPAEQLSCVSWADHGGSAAVWPSMTPAELLDTGFVDHIHGVILSTHCVTCWAGAQRELDYFVVSKQLAALACGLERDQWSVTRPHDALRLSLHPR